MAAIGVKMVKQYSWLCGILVPMLLGSTVSLPAEAMAKLPGADDLTNRGIVFDQWAEKPMAGAQTPEHEVQIVAASIVHLRAGISERAARPDAVILFDPTVVDGRYVGGAEDWDRAQRIEEELNVQVRTFQQATECPSSGPCRLTGDVLFRFGRPLIAGDTATVNVVFWFAGRPEWRDPTPLRAVELTFLRSGESWVVTDHRTLMMSRLPPTRGATWFSQIGEHCHTRSGSSHASHEGGEERA